jgi:hypothetical protein
LQTSKKTASDARPAAQSTHSRVGGARRGKSSRGADPLAIVVSVTVAVAACVPSSVTDEGEIEHVAAVGAPAQLHVTVWLNPPCGATDTVKFAVPPAAIV